MKSFRKLKFAEHVQHVFFDSRIAAQRFYETSPGCIRDVRLEADAYGATFAIFTRIVWSWMSPLRFIAPHLHRLPRVRGESLFTDDPYRNPLKRWCVTRTLTVERRRMVA